MKHLITVKNSARDLKHCGTHSMRQATLTSSVTLSLVWKLYIRDLLGDYLRLTACGNVIRDTNSIHLSASCTLKHLMLTQC